MGSSARNGEGRSLNDFIHNITYYINRILPIIPARFDVFQHLLCQYVVSFYQFYFPGVADNEYVVLLLS
jgi:hypothetical protein